MGRVGIDDEVRIHQGRRLEIRRLGAEGERAYLGRSTACPERPTRGGAIRPDRAAESARNCRRPEQTEWRVDRRF